MSKKFIFYSIGIVITVFITFLFVVAIGTAVLPIGLLFVATIYFICRRDKRSIFFFVACTVVQGLTLILYAPYITSQESNGLIIIKELLVYGLAIIGFVKAKRRTKEDIYFLFFCVIAIIGMIKASSLGLAIAGLRQMIIIFSCYYMGKAIKIKMESMKVISEYIVYMTLIVTIIGLLMYSMSDSDWLSIGYGEYWNNRTSGNVTANFINFYSWDFGFKLKRVVSTFVNPIACAHFIGMGFVIEFINKKKRYLIKILLTIGLLMCISKSSLVLVMVVVAVKYYSKIRNKYLRFMLIAFCAVVGMASLVFLSDYSESLNQATAISNHFNAFLYGIRNGSLLGQGLGTAGYNARLAGLTNFDEGYNESFLALCIAQIGVLGVVFIYLFLIKISRDSFNQYKRNRNSYNIISLILILSVTVESLFSASAVSLLGTGLYFIYAGICRNLDDINIMNGSISKQRNDVTLYGKLQNNRSNKVKI